MKKILLFSVIVAISIHVFAQTNQSARLTNHLKSSIVQTAKARLDAAGLKTTGLYTTVNFKNDVRHKTLQKLSSNDLIQVMDSVYSWQWNTSSLEWDISFKYKNVVYDANNNLSGYIGLGWDGSAWVNSSKYTANYDAYHNLISELYQDWNGSAWVNNSMFEYLYDANNNQTEFSFKQWNSTLWENQQKSISTYDANHNMLTQIYQNGSGSTWQNSNLFTWTVDANNNILTQTNQLWNGSGWDSQSAYSSYYTYTYDANDNMLSQLTQYLDGTDMWFQAKNFFTYDANNNLLTDLVQQSWFGSALKDSYKYQYTYDANNNLLVEADQTWTGSDWENTNQYIYTYDVNNNQTSESDQMWDGSKWLNSWQYNSSFDANGISLSNTYREWDETGAFVNYGDSSYYYYHTVVTGIPGLDRANATVYPNPAKGRITISSNNPISAIEIYSLSGKRIFADYKINQPSKEIDLTGYAKGVYFVKIYNGTKYYNRKVVLQ